MLGRLKAIDRRVDGAADPKQVLLDRVQRVTLRSDSVRIEIKFPSDLVRDQVDRKAILARTLPGDEATFQGKVLHLTAPVRMRFRGGRTWIFAAKGRDSGAEPRMDSALVAALKRGHATLAELGAAPQSRPDDLIDARAPDTAHLAKICRLALMAPDVQQAILAGRQPPGFTVQRVLDADIPVCWSDQRRHFGFEEA